jgi:putative aldouronate transport system substrate-binding protein
LVGSSEVPNYVTDLLAYTRRTATFLEEDPFEGMKLEKPPNFGLIATEDKIKDVIRGRRPSSDLKQIIAEWRRTGGDETREFLEKTLAESGR